MALRFIDGWDGYTNASDLPLKWNACTGSFSIQTGGRFGANCAQVASGGGGDYLTKFFDSQATWFVGVALKLTAYPPTPSYFLRVKNGTDVQVQVGVDAGGHLFVDRNGTSLTNGTGTTVLALNTWVYVELGVTIAASISANGCVVRLGGVNEVVVATGQDTSGDGTNSANRIELGTSWANNTNHIYFDDCYMCDGTGSANNTFLGDMRVELLTPSAAGNHQDFSVQGSGSPTSVSVVSDASEDGDTSYVYSSTTGNKETYTFTSLSNTPNVIAGVQTTIVARKDDAGSRSIAAMTRASSTDYIGTTMGVFDSYTYVLALMEQDPATSSAWTGTTVNALEAGFELVG